MKYAALAFVFLIAIGARRSQTECSKPLWTVDLVTQYGFRPFGLVKHPRNQLPPLWTSEEAVLFISGGVLAVYEVIARDDLSSLEPRDESGGGGKYVLQVVLLDAEHGKELRILRLITSGLAPSRVYRTHDGRFVVRAGDSLRLYSAQFEETAFKLLPCSDPVSHQTCVVSVHGSGKQIFVDYYPGKVLEALDADTLEPLQNSAVPKEDVQSDSRPFGFVAQDTSCPWGFGRLTPRFFVGYGCKELKVFLPDGQLFWDIPMSEQVEAVVANEDVLAAKIYHHRANPLDLDTAPEPLRIELYNLTTKSEICSIPYCPKRISGMWPSIPFDLSSTGPVAVIQGNELNLYHP